MLSVKKKPKEGSVELNIPAGSFLILEVDGVFYSVGFAGKHRHKRETRSPFDKESVTEAKEENLGTVRLVKPSTKELIKNGKVPDVEALREKIRARLKDYTEDEAAEFLGISSGTICKWRSGRFTYISASLKQALKKLKIKLPPKSSCLWHRGSSNEWLARRNTLTIKS